MLTSFNFEICEEAEEYAAMEDVRKLIDSPVPPFSALKPCLDIFPFRISGDYSVTSGSGVYIMPEV